MKLEKLESWKDSFRNYSQWVNTAIGVLGAAYLAMTPEMRSDLPGVVITVMAFAAFANILVRNTLQRKKYVA